MYMQKVAAWFLTDSGKSFSFCLATTVTLGTFLGKSLSHTFFIDKYKDVVHLYKSGLSVPLPKVLKERFDKALDLVGIPEEEKKLYKPFLAYGFDLFSIGTAYSKYGCRVGIPVNFTYADKDSIDKSIIKINNESVTWSLNEGQQLLNSFILSERAQLYGIAREIKTAESPKLLLDCAYPTISVIGLYVFSQTLNRKLNLYARPLALRLMLYSLISVFMCGNYVFAKDYTQVYFEKKVDNYLKNRDPVFVEGGKEFYEKILKRNIALRQLMGTVGESHYSVLGNENYFLRQRHIPLIRRKEFFEGKTDLEDVV